MAKKKLVLDPGHGGADPGALGNGLVEKSIAWTLANLVKEKLKRMKVDVVIVQPSTSNPKSTKDDELYLPPKEANKLGADFYLSLHVNAGGGTGFESFVHPNSQGKEADKLRNVLHTQIMHYMAEHGMMDRGKKYANFAVLRLTNMTSVLIECLFIDTAKDAALLKDGEFINGLANEIAYGLIIALGLERG